MPVNSAVMSTMVVERVPMASSWRERLPPPGSGPLRTAARNVPPTRAGRSCPQDGHQRPGRGRRGSSTPLFDAAVARRQLDAPFVALCAHPSTSSSAKPGSSRKLDHPGIEGRLGGREGPRTSPGSSRSVQSSYHEGHRLDADRLRTLGQRCRRSGSSPRVAIRRDTGPAWTDQCCVRRAPIHQVTRHQLAGSATGRPHRDWRLMALRLPAVGRRSGPHRQTETRSQGELPAPPAPRWCSRGAGGGSRRRSG